MARLKEKAIRMSVYIKTKESVQVAKVIASQPSCTQAKTSL